MSGYAGSTGQVLSVDEHESDVKIVAETDDHIDVSIGKSIWTDKDGNVVSDEDIVDYLRLRGAKTHECDAEDGRSCTICGRFETSVDFSSVEKSKLIEAAQEIESLRIACYEEHERLMVLQETIADARDQGRDSKNVYFYEREFYPLSNFSAFALRWDGQLFPTVEHAYHWEKFPNYKNIRDAILNAPSAHVAFIFAQEQKTWRMPDWDTYKVPLMKNLLRAKANQHEYVRRKLLATGDKILIENSWRDDFWGWGPNKKGQNMLGRLWMEVRAELRR